MDKKIRMFIEDDFLFLTESPDNVIVGSEYGTQKELFRWSTGGDAFAFGFKGGKCIISEEGNTHSDTYVGDRGRFDFPGRIWTRKKVISFWSYPPISKLKQLLKLMEKTFNDIPLDRYGQKEEDKYTNSRGEDYGKINFSSGWRMDVPAEFGDSYGDMTQKSGSKIIAPHSYEERGYLYSLKTIFSNKPLKGAGEKLRKGQKVNTDKGQEHVAPAMLKKGKMNKMSKKQKEDMYNYFKAKGRLSPAELRMYKMMQQRESLDIYFDGKRFIFQESMVNEDKKIRMFIDGEYLFLTESPDVITVGSDGSPKELFRWNDGPAFAFGYYKNKMHISEQGGMHSDMYAGDRRGMKFSGRMWPRKKVISFWTYPSTSQLKKVTKDIEKTFNDIELDRMGSPDHADNEFPSLSYMPRTRGSSYGKIKIDGNWKLDVPAETGDTYDDFVKGTGGADVAPKAYYTRGYLYALKTIYSKKPLKGTGEKLRKGKKVDTDKGQEHVKSAMLKKGKLKKMSKQQKTDMYNYFKAKGRLSPAELRMYKMMQQRESLDIYFDGSKFILESKISDELATFDSEQVSMGKKVEKEHDNDNDVDVIDSEEDLLKVVLAHLREDPKYYTKLKKVEESNKKFFTLEEGSGILAEAPHIAVGDQVIDFEFEKDKVAGLKKIIKAILKQEITDKYGSKFKLTSDSDVNEFIKKIMKNPQIKRMLT